MNIVFDLGGVVVKWEPVKPDAAIYQHLLHEYDLTAEETIFIDDMAVNLEAAARFGIRTIRFETPEQCAERLLELDLL